MKYLYDCPVHGNVIVEHPMGECEPRYCSRLDETSPFGDEICNEPLRRIYSATPFIPCVGMYAKGG